MSRGWPPADTPPSNHPQKAAGGSQTDPQAYQMLRLWVVRNPHPHPQVHQANPRMAYYCCSFPLHCPSVGHQHLLVLLFPQLSQLFAYFVKRGCYIVRHTRTIHTPCPLAVLTPALEVMQRESGPCHRPCLRSGTLLRGVLIRLRPSTNPQQLCNTRLMRRTSRYLRHTS